jgi:Protein of unknown function (DUF3592)
MARKIRIDSGAGVVALVGLVFLIVGGILGTVFCWGLPTDIGIERRPLALVGEVTQVELLPSRRINRKPATRISYRYRVDGVAHDDELLTIDAGLIAAVQRPGATVALQVDRAHPERSRIEGTMRAIFGWGGALTLLMPLLGLLLLATAGVLALRARR